MNEEQIKKQYEEITNSALNNKKWLAIGVGIICLALFSSIAVAALTAGLALTGLLAVGLVLTVSSIYVYKKFPLWIQQIENKVVEAKHKEMLQHIANLKSSAKLNPIEQMEMTYQQKATKLQEFNQAVIALKASVDKQQRRLKQIKKDTPHYDMSEEEEQTEKMEQYVILKEQQLNSAKATLAQFKDTVNQVKVKWEFQLEANAAIKAMNQTDKESIMNELLTETAFEEVHTSFDKVFAQMELEMNSLTNITFSAKQQAITNKSSNEEIETVEVSYATK